MPRYSADEKRRGAEKKAYIIALPCEKSMVTRRLHTKKPIIIIIKEKEKKEVEGEGRGTILEKEKRKGSRKKRTTGL